MQSLQTSTTKALDALDIKLRLRIGDDISVKVIPARIDSLADLETIARTLCDKNGVPGSQKFVINYRPEDQEPIIVKDDADLQTAYALALSGTQAIKFQIKLTG